MLILAIGKVMSEKRALMSITINAGLPGARVLTTFSSRSHYCHVLGIYLKFCQYSHK